LDDPRLFYFILFLWRRLPLGLLHLHHVVFARFASSSTRPPPLRPPRFSLLPYHLFAETLQPRKKNEREGVLEGTKRRRKKGLLARCSRICSAEACVVNLCSASRPAAAATERACSCSAAVPCRSPAPGTTPFLLAVACRRAPAVIHQQGPSLRCTCKFLQTTDGAFLGLIPPAQLPASVSSPRSVSIAWLLVSLQETVQVCTVSLFAPRPFARPHRFSKRRAGLVSVQPSTLYGMTLMTFYYTQTDTREF
jgi:hypothetical protein